MLCLCHVQRYTQGELMTYCERQKKKKLVCKQLHKSGVGKFLKRDPRNWQLLINALIDFIYAKLINIYSSKADKINREITE